MRDKSAAELRLEYILLKQKAKESEREHLLQPSTELTCGIDMTDFFDRYLKVCALLPTSTVIGFRYLLLFFALGIT